MTTPTPAGDSKSTGRARRRTRANGEESRQRILDADRMAGERGYEGTTISLVSAKSGLPPARSTGISLTRTTSSPR